MTSAGSRSARATGWWEHFAHGADVGIRGIGGTMDEAFGQAAVALTAVVCDVATVRSRQDVGVALEAPTPELLLVDWLNAVIYEMATRRMLFGEFDVSIRGHELRGRLRGEPVDRARHEPAVEVKGATHTALLVSRTPDAGWLAQCVLDV